MNTRVTILAALLACAQVAPAVAQHAHRRHHHKPKNTVNQLVQARRTDHTVRQVTPNPKLSPGKHADNLSKNVNHEVNRESKDFNHGVNNLSKSINHAFQGKKAKP